MLTQLAISGALLVGTMIPVHAQQREATLHRVETPGAPFDLLIAAPKPGGVTTTSLKLRTFGPRAADQQYVDVHKIWDRAARRKPGVNLVELSMLRKTARQQS